MGRKHFMGVLLSTAMIAVCVPAKAQTVDVVHYWTSKSESRTINVLADAYKAKGGKWIDSPVANFDEAVAASNSRITGGKPPSAILMNPGSTLDELVAAGYMRDLTDVAKAENWAKIVSPHVLSEMTSDGKVVAVPLGLHGANWLWYSKKIFTEVGLEPPKTWDELLASAEKIKAAGYTPFAVGGENWQINYVMTSILAGVGGEEFYKKVFVEHDAEAAADPAVAKSFEILRKLQPFVDDASAGRSWNETTALLIQDRAAMQILGDYVKGEFAAAGKQVDKDYGCALAPDTQNMYMVYTDMLAITNVNDPEVIKGQDLLIATALDPKVEAEMSKSKGSTPGRIDVSSSDLDSCAQIGSQALAGGKTIFAGAYETLTPDQMGQITDLVGEFWTDKSMTPETAAERFAAIF